MHNLKIITQPRMRLSKLSFKTYSKIFTFLFQNISSQLASEMILRSTQLRRECQKLRDKGYSFGNLSQLTLQHLIVNDEQKTIYCFVPKVACTNLKRVFLFLTGRINVSSPLNLTKKSVHGAHVHTLLSSFSSKEREYRLKNYTKVVFVREPLIRLLSAFRSKFINTTIDYHFHKKFGRNIAQMFRQNSSQSSFVYENDVTFSEFVQFLIKFNMSSETWNQHWTPVYELCNPCHVQYDFIGKFESIATDTRLLLKEMAVEDQIPSFPERENSNKRSEETIESYYSTLQAKQLVALIKLYDNDYKLFGYPMPVDLFHVVNQ